jgi:hypothetical protein
MRLCLQAIIGKLSTLHPLQKSRFGERERWVISKRRIYQLYLKLYLSEPKIT